MRATFFTFAIATLVGTACGQEPPSTPNGTSQVRPEDQTASKMAEAFEAYKRGDFSKCVSMYEQVASAAPDNVQAQNMIGNCAERANDYSRAVAAFKRALELMPDESHNISGLMETYNLAGMKSEADALRQHIHDLGQQKRLPPNFHFVIERFAVGDKNVEVTEFYPDLAGKFNFKYWFTVTDKANNSYRIALESDDIDQVSYKKKHPADAAAGKRSFSLDGYYPGPRHATFKFYDGDPTYETVRADVQDAVSGQTKPESSTVITTAPPK